jgi:hemerythrin
MQWAENLSVGVASVDMQHKELINRTNEFTQAMKSGGGKDEVLKIMDFLAQYVVTHFRDEEALQIRYNYPKYQEHRKLHLDFVADVERMRKDIAQNGMTIATSIMVSSTLSNWLITHITRHDRELGAFIRSKGGN